MPRKCPACGENLGFVDFVKHTAPGLLICPGCNALVSGPLLRQRWFVRASIGFTLLTLLAWFIALLEHASVLSQAGIIAVGGIANGFLSLWLLYKRTPLTIEQKAIIRVDKNNLIIDPHYSVSPGAKLSPNVLSASDGPLSVPLTEVQSIRINEGYFVVYREPAGHPIEVFYPPILQSCILSAIQENGLESKIVKESQP